MFNDPSEMYHTTATAEAEVEYPHSSNSSQFAKAYVPVSLSLLASELRCWHVAKRVSTLNLATSSSTTVAAWNLPYGTVVPLPLDYIMVPYCAIHSPPVVVIGKHPTTTTKRTMTHRIGCRNHVREFTESQLWLKYMRISHDFVGHSVQKFDDTQWARIEHFRTWFNNFE